MKTSLTTIIVAIVVMAAASCKKNDNPQTAPSSKVKTYIEDASKTPYNTIDTFNVTYDASDRVVSLLSTSRNAGFYYTYNSNNSFTMDIKDGSHLIIREISYINSNQLVDSTFQYNDTGDSSTTRLIYNSSNQLTQLLNYDYSKTGGAVLSGKETYTYDNNGNMIKQTDTNASGAITLTTTLIYNTIVASPFTMNTVYRPIVSKNLPVTTIYTSPSGQNAGTLNMAYTFDNNNRIVTQTDSDNYGNVVVKKFLYY